MQKEFSGISSMEPEGDFILQDLVNVLEPLDLSVPPSVNDGQDGVFQDGIDQGVHDLAVQIINMFSDNPLHDTGILELLDLLDKFPQFLIDAAAPGQALADREFGIGPGNDHGIRKDLQAPVPDGRHLGNAAGQEEELRLIPVDVLFDILQALQEDLLEGSAVQTVCGPAQNVTCNLPVHLQGQAYGQAVVDPDVLGTGVSAPVFLIGEIFLLEPPGGEFTVAAPGRDLVENSPDLFLPGRPLQGFLQQQLIHDAAAQADFAGRTQLHLMPFADIGEIGRRGANIHDQDRMSQDIVSDLQMFGLAGADQGRPGFRDDPGGRIAHLFKDPPVSLPGVLVPTGRTADVETAVLSLDQVSVLIELAQDAGREAADIRFAFPVRQEMALEAKLAFRRPGVVAGAFSYDQLLVEEPGIGCDKALRLADRQHLRLFCPFFGKYTDGTFRVAQVKTKKSFHNITGSLPSNLLPCRPLFSFCRQLPQGLSSTVRRPPPGPAAGCRPTGPASYRTICSGPGCNPAYQYPCDAGRS